MEKYLNRGIKEIIEEFPEVGSILDTFGIGCGPCSVGTCLLKDIVEIHDLPAAQEKEMMARIAKVIYPDRVIPLPMLQRKQKPAEKAGKYSPPIKALVAEHLLIKRWVALIPSVAESLDLDSDMGRQRIRSGIDFIRSYADRFHHAKEEEILFKYFDEDSDILKAMHLDHKRARNHVAAMIDAIENHDIATLSEHLLSYGALLSEHIKKEDEILYPWMDKNLTTSQIGELFSKFDEIDKEMKDAAKDHETFIALLEKSLKP